MSNKELVEHWFEIHDYNSELKFENIANKLHPCKQVGAIMFLANKLKDKNERSFLHGEHDSIYIGSSFEIFEDFTEEEVKTAIAYGLFISDDGDGFEMYASM